MCEVVRVGDSLRLGQNHLISSPLGLLLAGIRSLRQVGKRSKWSKWRVRVGPGKRGRASQPAETQSQRSVADVQKQTSSCQPSSCTGGNRCRRLGKNLLLLRSSSTAKISKGVPLLP